MNGRYLVRPFQRPIELIYNPTEGPLLDLLECMLGRTFDFVSAPAEYALERVSLALANPEKDRVILMGHSQGGIIVSNVVSALIERFSGDRERMSKLEVYTFASASASASASAAARQTAGTGESPPIEIEISGRPRGFAARGRKRPPRRTLRFSVRAGC